MLLMRTHQVPLAAFCDSTGSRNPESGLTKPCRVAIICRYFSSAVVGFRDCGSQAYRNFVFLSLGVSAVRDPGDIGSLLILQNTIDMMPNAEAIKAIETIRDFSN